MDVSDIDLAEPCVLLKRGESGLKGRNRQRFERMLFDNIRAALRDVGVPVDVWRREGVMVLRVDTGQHGPGHPGAPGAVGVDPVETVDAAARRVCSVMGIVRVHRAVRVRKDAHAAAAAEVALTAGATGPFGVRARRRDKRFPMRSTELAAHIGSRIQQAHGLAVNLSHPDTRVFVEVDTHEVFVFTGGMPGQGGLLVGRSGRGLVRMSGGIDSPVAAYRMMRRGLRCDFLHFSGMPLTGPESIYKAYALIRELDQFQGRSRLFVVAFGKTQQRLAANGAERLQILAQRTPMLKTRAAPPRHPRAPPPVTRP